MRYGCSCTCARTMTWGQLDASHIRAIDFICRSRLRNQDRVLLGRTCFLYTCGNTVSQPSGSGCKLCTGPLLDCMRFGVLSALELRSFISDKHRSFSPTGGSHYEVLALTPVAQDDVLRLLGRYGTAYPTQPAFQLPSKFAFLLEQRRLLRELVRISTSV